MKRVYLALAGLTGLTLAISLTLTLTLGQRGATTGTVYTVAQVVAGLGHDPARWVGQTVLVRGRITQVEWERGVWGRGTTVSVWTSSGGGPPRPLPCTATPTGCPSPLARIAPPPGAVLHVTLTPEPLDPGGPFPALWLRLQPPASDPLLDFLRRLPLVGGLAPAPQQVRWAAYVVYRIRILPRHNHTFCASHPCDDALLAAVP